MSEPFNHERAEMKERAERNECTADPERADHGERTGHSERAELREVYRQKRAKPPPWRSADSVERSI
jgi:hypothetical protein